MPLISYCFFASENFNSMAKAITGSSGSFNTLKQEQVSELVIALQAEVRKYPLPFPKAEMSKLMRIVHAMKKKEHEKYIRRLRKFLLKRQRAQVQKLPPKPQFVIPDS
jgi:hypothetical protein